MFSKSKISRRQHSKESIAVILKLYSLEYSSSKIGTEIDVLKSIVTRIIKQADLHSNIFIQSTKRSGRPPKLNKRGERALLRYIAKFSKETLAALLISSKSGQRLHPNTIRRYLKKN
jgi:transposase